MTCMDAFIGNHPVADCRQQPNGDLLTVRPVRSTPWHGLLPAGYAMTRRVATPAAPRLWVPKTYATCRYSCSRPPARSRLVTRKASRSISFSGQWSHQCGLAQGPVRPVVVVEGLVLAQPPHQVRDVPDQRAVGQLRARESEPALHHRVLPRRPNTGTDHLDPRDGEDLVEADMEDRITVVDQEPGAHP